MKQIVEIARRELYSIFCSPIGWITLIILIVHFVFIVSARIDSTIWALVNRDIEIDYYTSRIFSGFNAAFGNLTSYFYLYIPLLTMGLLSREYNEGGIKLLFSSPIRTHEIVLGKFIAIVIYTILMTAALGAVILFVRFFVIDVLDLPLILAGLLLIFLILCLYTSIGLFISSLTSYQLAAAVGTFAVLFVLNTYLSTLVQSHHPEILQLLASEWLPPRAHLEGIRGLLNSSNIYYFLLLTGLFLSLTYLRLHFMRNASGSLYKISIISALILSTLFLGVYTFTPDRFIYIDATAKKLYTPSEEQQLLLEDFDQPFKFTRYVNILSAPTAGSVTGLFGRIGILNQIRSRTKIKVEIDYIPYFAPTNALHISLISEDTTFSDAAILSMQTSRRINRSTEGMDLLELAKMASEQNAWIDFNSLRDSVQILELMDLRLAENRASYSLRAGDYDTTILRGQGAPSDQLFTTTLKRLQNGPVNVGFIWGNGGRDPNGTDDSGYLRIFNHKAAEHSLPNLGFELVLLELDFPIPDSVSILVLAEPVIELSEVQKNNFMNFVDNGGNLLLITSNSNFEFVQPLVQKLGLSFNKAEFLNQNYYQIYPNSVRSDSNTEFGFLENHVMKYYNLTSRLLDKNGEGHFVTVPNPSAITVLDNTNYRIDPIIKDDNKLIIAALSRNINGKEQRIIVSGDADFLSNSVEGIGYFSAFRDRPANHALAASLFRWLSNDEYPALVDREEQMERLMISDSARIKYSMLLILPLPFLVIGTIIVRRRKKK